MRSTGFQALSVVFVLPILFSIGAGVVTLMGDLVGKSVGVPSSDPNAYTCECTCFAGTRREMRREFSVCMPEGGRDLGDDCETRVRSTMLGFVGRCGSTEFREQLDASGREACTCTPSSVAWFVPACTGECVSTTLDPSCSNQDEASSVAGLALCLAEPPKDGLHLQTMGRAIFGGRSTCEVEGSLTVASEEPDPLKRPTHGVFEFFDQSCSRSGCETRMVYRLDGIGHLRLSSFAGLVSSTLKDIAASGGSSEPALLDASGRGAFPALGTSSAGRATRVDEGLWGVIADSTERSYVGNSAGPVRVGVDRAGRECEIEGPLLGALIGDVNDPVVVHVAGEIVNRPPTASAGTDRDVECTSPLGAAITLTDESTDPDDDIVFREWRLGGPGGAPIADPDDDGVVGLEQALGTTAMYSVNVVDSYISVSQDTTEVSVVDTTAPRILSVSASRKVVREQAGRMVPIAIEVSASDICGPPMCEITAVTANQPIVGIDDDNPNPIDWQILGPLRVALRAKSTDLVEDRVYTIVVTCVDAASNEATTTAEVRVRNIEDPSAVGQRSPSRASPTGASG